MRRSSLVLAGIGLVAVLVLSTFALRPVWSRGGAAALPSTVPDQAEWLGDRFAAWAWEVHRSTLPPQALETARKDLVDGLCRGLDKPLTMRQALDLEIFLVEYLSYPLLDAAAPEDELRHRVAVSLTYFAGYLAAARFTREDRGINMTPEGPVDAATGELLEASGDWAQDTVGSPVGAAEHHAIARQMGGLLDYFLRCLLEELTPMPADVEGTTRVIAGDVYAAATQRVAHDTELALSPRFKRLLTDEEIAYMEARARELAATSGASWREYRALLMDFKGPGYTVLPGDLLGEAGGTASSFLCELQDLYSWTEEAAP